MVIIAAAGRGVKSSLVGYLFAAFTEIRSLLSGALPQRHFTRSVEIGFLRHKSMPTLSIDQLAVLESVRSGHNVLITGPGGTGKSFLLWQLQMQFPIEVCGSTGVAAVNVGGVTLHSWAGLGLADRPALILADGVRNNKKAHQRILTTSILAIDEISMVSAELFDKLDKVFRIIRSDDRPFGGVQILAFGDFLQLPPVEGEFAFDSDVWGPANFKVHLLTHIFRQEDVAFARALSELRNGALSQESKDLLRPRQRAVDDDPLKPPVIITATNKECDRINDHRLGSLAPIQVFRATDTGSPQALKLLERSLVPFELRLAPGARVMCLANLDPEIGVMNGSTGTVVQTTPYITVKFDRAGSFVMPLHEKEVKLDGKVIGKRSQYPLRLAWSITSHKSQGLTLDKVELRMASAFEAGQTYVAMSRVKTLGGLFINGLNKANLTSANPKAVQFYASHA